MLRLAKTALLLLVFSLPFTKPAFPIGGLPATVSDLLFLAAAGALTLAVARGEARLRWDPLYAVLLAWFGAMLASAMFAADPGRAALKLATQAYLLSLPLLAATLVQNLEDLRSIVRAWLAATAVTAGIGMLALLLFGLGIAASFALHEFGSLPAGDYPRLESTFRYPAMLCNYLTVSLLLLLVARRLGWIGSAALALLLGATLATAAFTLTPGLGGFVLALGLWLWLAMRNRESALAAASLAAGIATALAFFAAAAVTPFLHPTAPFLFELPGLTLAPSVRMMAWIDAAQIFLRQPLLGAGIGADAASVFYVAPSGSTHRITDAHNVFLSVAAQCGLAGLAAILWLIASVARRTGPLRLFAQRPIAASLGLAWLVAFAVEGLTGSYEDARHLWLLLGLLIAADRLERERAA